MHTFTETAPMKLFPQKGGWYYVPLPREYTDMTKDRAERGLVPVVAKVGDTEWKTSLLPMGDGTLFIAMNAKVRKAEKLELGTDVTVEFTLR